MGEAVSFREFLEEKFSALAAMIREIRADHEQVSARQDRLASRQDELGARIYRLEGTVRVAERRLDAVDRYNERLTSTIRWTLGLTIPTLLAVIGYLTVYLINSLA